MTPRDQTAFNAGIAHAAAMERIAAITIETRDDARTVRQQAAAAALHALAEGLRDAAGKVRSPPHTAREADGPTADRE